MLWRGSFFACGLLSGTSVGLYERLARNNLSCFVANDLAQVNVRACAAPPWPRGRAGTEPLYWAGMGGSGGTLNHSVLARNR